MATVAPARAVDVGISYEILRGRRTKTGPQEAKARTGQLLGPSKVGTSCPGLSVRGIIVAMNIKMLLALSILAGGLLAGCASESPATETTSASSSSTPVANQEVAKCDTCGKEVPKATLASHDNKMMCQACMATHQH